MTLDVPKFNVSFDAKAGLEGVKNNAEETLKTAATDIVSSIIIAGANKEKVATSKRAIETTKDATETTTKIQEQKQICSLALDSIVQLVQTGELDLQQFQNFLKNQVIQSIKDNNAKGETLQETMEELSSRNEEIKQEIAELNGGSLEGIEFEEVKTDSTGGNTPSTDNNTSQAGNKQTVTTKKVVKSNGNSNAEKIQALLEEYNSNIGMISSMQNELINVMAAAQAEQVEQGNDTQSKTEQKHSEIVNNTQTKGQNLFQKISNGINNLFNKGKSKQLGHQATGTTMATVDTTAATIKSGEAAAATGGSVFTLGATSGIAAEAAAEAAIFLDAATNNTFNVTKTVQNVIRGESMKNIVGDYVAEQVTNEINNQLSGAVTEITTEILGEDVAQYVAPELANLAQIEAPKENLA